MIIALSTPITSKVVKGWMSVRNTRNIYIKDAGSGVQVSDVLTHTIMHSSHIIIYLPPQMARTVHNKKFCTAYVRFYLCFLGTPP